MNREEAREMGKIVLYLLCGAEKMTHAELSEALVKYHETGLAKYELGDNFDKKFEVYIDIYEHLGLVKVFSTEIFTGVVFNHFIVSLKRLEAKAYNEQEIQALEKLITL